MIDSKKTVNSANSDSDKTKRNTIRWMLVMYDSIAYLLLWVLVFVFHPSTTQSFNTNAMVYYLFAGYACYFGFRTAFDCYRLIFRYGSNSSLVKQVLSDTLAFFLLVGIELVLKYTRHSMVPIMTAVTFAAVYTLTSLLARIVYCRLYAFAEKEGKLAAAVKRFLEIFAFVDFDSKEPGATLHLVLEPQKCFASPINELQNIVEKFAVRGEVTSITQINKGYINRTFRVETMSDRDHVHKYTLQRINTNVFTDVDLLMENFRYTTDRLFGRFFLPGHKTNGSIPTIRPTKDGRSYYCDASGCWRIMTYFDDVYSLDIPDNPKTFYYAGYAFGSFMKEMTGIDESVIKEVIPNFHNTLSRYNDLENAIKNDVKCRVDDVLPEIEFIRQHKHLYGLISTALEAGEIPTRICHNDCNLNNILFDNKTGLPVAIVDLDTVMPSSPLYDYGDSMRIGTNTARDDEKDLSKVSCDLNMYEQYARGYLEACGDILTKRELELLPYASLVITAEDGIRFLMDHINGDTYYNIYYPGQNLDRSRTQLKLLDDMERKLPQIKQILAKIYDELGLISIQESVL